MASDQTKFLTTKYGPLELTTATLKTFRVENTLENNPTLTPLPNLLHPLLPQSPPIMGSGHFESVIMMTVQWPKKPVIQSVLGRCSLCLSGLTTPWARTRKTGLCPSQKVLELLTCSWAPQGSLIYPIEALSTGGTDQSPGWMD